MDIFDKAAIKAEIWLNRHIIRMSETDNLKATSGELGHLPLKQGKERMVYITNRFPNAKVCSCCDGTGLLSLNFAEWKPTTGSS